MDRQQFVDRMGWEPPHGWIPGRVPKPASCHGCPLHGKSTYYVPDELHNEADTLILLEKPDAESEKLGIPAVGKAGDILNTHLLPLAGLQRGRVSVAHVIKCRGGSGAHAVSAADVPRIVWHCTTAHLSIPSAVNLVITQGKLPLDYATDTVDKPIYSVNNWRGYTLPYTRFERGKVDNHNSSPPCHNPITTYAVAEPDNDSTMRWVSDNDWRRISDLRRQAYPLARPRWLHASTSSVDPDTVGFFGRAKDEAAYLVIDTEFIPENKTLTILGIAAVYGHSGNHATSGPKGHWTYTPSHQWSHHSTHTAETTVLSVDWKNTPVFIKSYIRWKLKELCQSKPVVFHNAQADIPVLEQACGITYNDYYQVEDTMLAHAALWCELPHGLEFLASIYGKYGKFKHLRHDDELLYNYGDVVDTQCVWEGMLRGFASDAKAEAIYREQSLKLVPILLQAGKEGIRVNKVRVVEVFNEYFDLTRRIQRYAQLAVGYGINLNSGKQLQHYLYTVRQFPVQIDKDTKRPTTSDDAINRLRQGLGAFDANRTLTFDQDNEQCHSIVARVAAGADPILEARALWSSSWHTVNNYIIGLCKGVYDETSANKKKKARERYWKEGITGNGVVDRIYPNFATHAQKTGRWSTTDPPLAQLPATLRDIICPDEGEICISWDWSAIEPRVLQALTGSTLLKKTFDENFDLHTWTVCYMFGYDFPPDLVDPHKSPSCEAWRAKYNWKGKDDPRRVFAKQGRYEMWYGGTGSNAAQAAASFGLNAKDLKVALAKLATSDPAYYTWKIKTEAEVKQTALIRTFMGRPRRFLSSGDTRRREGLDYPMQGAVSDIFNTTAIKLKQQFPYLRWGWGMHDSQKWYVNRTLLTEQRFTQIKAVVERAHTIAGQVTKFPGDFEIIYPPEQGNRKVTPKQHFALAA